MRHNRPMAMTDIGACNKDKNLKKVVDDEYHYYD